MITWNCFSPVTALLVYVRPKKMDSTINVTLLLEEAAHGADVAFAAQTDDCEDHDDYYRAGCQAWFPAIIPKAGCAAGDPNGLSTVALIGDSKAAQWFRAPVLTVLSLANCFGS